MSVDIVIGMPVEFMDDPIAGSIQWDADCGHKVWLSPSTVQFLVQDPQSYLVKCPTCVMKDDL